MYAVSIPECSCLNYTAFTFVSMKCDHLHSTLHQPWVDSLREFTMLYVSVTVYASRLGTRNLAIDDVHVGKKIIFVWKNSKDKVTEKSARLNQLYPFTPISINCTRTVFSYFVSFICTRMRHLRLTLISYFGNLAPHTVHATI